MTDGFPRPPARTADGSPRTPWERTTDVFLAHSLAVATVTARSRSATRPGSAVAAGAKVPATATTVRYTRGVTVGAARPVMPTLNAVRTARAIPLPRPSARRGRRVRPVRVSPGSVRWASPRRMCQADRMCRVPVPCVHSRVCTGACALRQSGVFSRELAPPRVSARCLPERGRRPRASTVFRTFAPSRDQNRINSGSVTLVTLVPEELRVLALFLQRLPDHSEGHALGVALAGQHSREAS